MTTLDATAMLPRATTNGRFGCGRPSRPPGWPSAKVIRSARPGAGGATHSERQLNANETDQGVRHPRVRVRIEDMLYVGLDGEPGCDRSEVRQLERRFDPVDALSGLPLLVDEVASVVGGGHAEADLVL